jgi:hypothetical protein
MLLNQSILAGIADGSVTTVFRRWKQPRVKKGSTFKSPVGVIAVAGIVSTRLDDITERAARQAGYASRAALLEELARHPGGKLFRISVRLEGVDPRIELRSRSRLGAEELVELESRLAGLGARTAAGPWAESYLKLIDAQPAVRAPDLAAQVGQETAPFKARVRQLKELGLTESLKVGYRLSPRGRAVLRALVQSGKRGRGR